MEKLRVYHIPQLPMKAFYVPVTSVEEGRKIIDILSCYDLFQLENHIKPDFSNTNGLQKFDEEEQEWVDWNIETKDSYYDNIDDYLKDNNEVQNFTKELFVQLKGCK